MITPATSKYMSASTPATSTTADHAERGDGADRDQRVHRRRTVSRVRERRPMERPAAPGDDRRCERERSPLPALELERRNHREQHERSGQGGGDGEATPGAGRLGASLLSGQQRPVAGGLHGRDQVTLERRRRERDRRALGGVVHRRVDAVQLVQLPLDPRRARGARHPFDRQLEPLGAHVTPLRSPLRRSPREGLRPRGSPRGRAPAWCRRRPRRTRRRGLARLLSRPPSCSEPQVMPATV